METHVYDFTDGSMEQRDLLGGKGANLAEMTRMGLPVPPGFTVTTEACRAYLAAGHSPAGLDEQVGVHLSTLEERMQRRLSDAQDPLLVSVRSGARFSMPGMMETVLDVGLNDVSVLGLARQSGSERFAWDSYRRLIQMFGATVLGIDAHLFAVALDDLKASRQVTADLELTAADLKSLVTTYGELVEKESGHPFPQDPREQLDLAIRAVFDSWNTERARIYRRQEQIPEDLGTAVNVQAMVFGNRGPTSGSGVCFTRDPATGRRGVYGDYLSDAQGEDVVAGIRNTVPLTDLEQLDPTSYAQLLQVMDTLERHYRDLCDIEFTIERGRLWVLQTRVGKRTGEAAFRIAADMVADGSIDLDEALLRVTGAQLAGLMFPHFDPTAPRVLVTRGMNASPGAAVGRIAFDSATAVTWAGRGDDVILVREETDPDDLPGLIAAKGVLTSRGGRTSHAAVVARGLGRTCVCGADDLEVDATAKRLTVRGSAVTLAEGDLISLDGATGEVFAGSVPVVDSPVVRWFEGGPAQDDLVAAVALLIEHADLRRRLDVRANADTTDDAARARRFGASGIGLCRTEHMFLGERRQLVERMIVAEDDRSREAALAALLPLQREDFVGILTAMDGLPVTVRLLDPPLHEFLPDLTELSVRVALAEERGSVVDHDVRLLAEVRRLHEQNPMLGLRGVRLGLVVPGLYATQARALLLAAAERLAAGADPRVEIMVPLVASVHELELVRAELEQVRADVEAEVGSEVPCRIGTMIEVPRAALTAAAIADRADFFSFGTNDLTQMTWGFSRDDVEASFFSEYLDRGVFPISPFESLDVEGVGALVRTATEDGRRANPQLHVGVCGEHGGDPRSIHFFQEVGLDYVSCSPFRVPVARLEAGRAALMKEPTEENEMTTTHGTRTSTTEPPLDRIIELASRAPSVHNTQPWTWRMTGAGLELLADRSRQLPLADPLGRNVTISCGAALNHLQVAAAAMGWDAEVDRVPEGPGSPVLARIVLSRGERSDTADADLLAIVDRRTDRRRFTSWQVPAERLQHLANAAIAQGVHAVPLLAVSARFRAEQLVAQAVDRQRSDPGIALEQQAWVGHSAVDGIPETALPREASAARGGRPDRFAHGATEDSTRLVDDADGLLVLCSGSDDVDSWLRAGEGLSSVWLMATTQELSVVPLSQVVEVEETRRALQDDVLGGLGHPLLLLRIGWQSTSRQGLPRTSRRPVGDVLQRS